MVEQIASELPLGYRNSYNRLQRFLRHQRTHFRGTGDTAHAFLQTWFTSYTALANPRGVALRMFLVRKDFPPDLAITGE